MQGVARISGSSNPLIGEETFYEVAEFYPDTPIRDYDRVKWKLFREENGQWRELRGTLKQGRRVSFSFPQKWYGKQLLVEAFMFNPEKKTPPGIVISPIHGPKNIRHIELRDVEGNELQEPPKYGQNITARITTENMLGDTLRLSLWERDTYSDTGHNAEENQELWNGTAKVTATNGIVTKQITLSPAMMVEANKNWFEGGEHEYYMVVRADDTLPKYSSQTMTVQNEEEVLLSPDPPQRTPTAQEEDSQTIMEQITVAVRNLFGLDEMPETGKTVATVNEGEAINNCGERYCIKKGEKSELIREINIRLAGFGGNVPTDEFTDQTENMIKQFQRDYMKIAETGRVCGNTLRAIDEFGQKYTVNFDQIECNCGTCSGFGQEQFAEEYNDAGILERYRKYEYPGVHRTLIWTLKAIMFYLSDVEKDLGLKLGIISSGYRCHVNNAMKGRTSTNHMGKALDIHVYKTDDSISTEANCDEVRDLLKEYSNAQDRWANPNRIALEPSTRIRRGKEFIATTWVHYDVREFDLTYKEKQYFVKTEAEANGEPIVSVAMESGLTSVCECMAEGNNSNAENASLGAAERVSPESLNISQEGVDFIKDWEKFRAMPYDDEKDYCTIGYGHLIGYSKCKDMEIPDEFKNGITEEKATELFNGRLAEFESAVKRDITVNLYQHEYDALVSLLFNTGANFLNVGGANEGETKIKKNINNGDYAAGADEMADVTNGGSKGLIKRRQAEINMFKNNIYDSTH